MITSQDFVKGIDLTVQPNSSQFNQVVDAASPAPDRGLVIETIDDEDGNPVVPDPDSYDNSSGQPVSLVKFKRYLWRRVRRNLAPIVYQWNESIQSNSTFLKWVDINTVNNLIVDSIQDLRNIDVSSLELGTIVTVKGYYKIPSTSPSLGSSDNITRGGGFFMLVDIVSQGIQYSSLPWINSLSPRPLDNDGGRLVKPNNYNGSKRWLRLLFGETPNVRMWGAIGSGFTTNEPYDTEGIKTAAIICSAFNYWSSKLEIPRGIYYINQSIFFAAGLEIIGAGPDTTIITDGSCDAFVTFNALGALGLYSAPDGENFYDHRLQFHRLCIRLGRNTFTDDTEHAGLVVSNLGEASTISNVTINGGRYGVKILGGGAPGASLIDMSISQPYEAAIYVTPKPSKGPSAVASGMIRLLRCSGDGIRRLPAMPSYLKMVRSMCSASVEYLKTEGVWADSLIHWELPHDFDSDIGYVIYKGGTHNGPPNGTAEEMPEGTWHPKMDAYPIVRVKTVQRTAQPNRRYTVPRVIIEHCQCYGLSRLIEDEIAGFHVPIAPFAPSSYHAACGTGAGLQQNFNHRLEYRSQLGGNNAQSVDGPIITMLLDGCPCMLFRPTEGGWWRVAREFSRYTLSGVFTINYYADTTVFTVRSGNRYGSNSPSIIVNSCNRYNNTTSDVDLATSVFTKARIYNTSEVNQTGASYAFLELYVNGNTLNKLLSTLGYEEHWAVIYWDNPKRHADGIGFTIPKKVTLLNPEKIVNYAEAEFLDDSALIISGGRPKTGTIHIGGNYLYFDDKDNLYTLNNGVEIIFVGSCGSPARAIAYIEGGKIVSVAIIDPGYGYNETPQVFAVPNIIGNGSGAVLQAVRVNDKIRAVNVLDGGNGYGVLGKPSFTVQQGYVLATNGKRIEMEEDVGYKVSNIRVISAVDSIVATTTQGGYLLNGSGYEGKLFPGDRLMNPSGDIFTVVRVLSDSSVLVDRPTPSGTAVTYNKVGWQFFPEKYGYKYNIASISAYNATNTLWAPTNNPNVTVAVGAFTNSTYPSTFVLLGFMTATAINNVANAIQVTYVDNMFGAYCPNNYGIEARLVRSNTDLSWYVPSAGGSISVALWGVRSKSGYNY